MKIEPFGNIEFNNKNNEWFGLVDNICPNNKVELSISVSNLDENLEGKIEFVKQMASNYQIIISNLYDFAYKKYKDTVFEVTRQDIEKMYFLTAIHLEEDNLTWGFTLEPFFNVISIYNHFLRFSIKDGKVIWTNFDLDTTTNR